MRHKVVKFCCNCCLVYVEMEIKMEDDQKPISGESRLKKVNISMEKLLRLKGAQEATSPKIGESGGIPTQSV